MIHTMLQELDSLFKNRKNDFFLREKQEIGR